MDESNKSLQAKLSQLNDQLDNYSSSVDDIQALKLAMQDILEDLELLSDLPDSQRIN
ncbi:hypothetical protein [Aestuariibacter sp. GS-14]|uniref:hypothetical protein n=1 Tax=Aestuariibacter sp. GS-14 TaxID=2590670 RepID=UPI0015E86E1E|nr:hypothetical protein [Aestuariibacter sp. GS-14]